MADLPEDRLRLARLWRNGGAQLFSPAGFAVIPRGTKKPRAAVLRPHPIAQSRWGPREGAPPVVSELTMAIEATMVAARYSKETGQ